MPKISQLSPNIQTGQVSMNPDVKSASRVLDIFELLAAAPSGYTLTDIGKRLRIPLSSLHGLTNTLVNRGYLVRNDGTMLFRLGPSLTRVASLINNQFDLIPLADPVMLRLRNELCETVSLSILEGTVIVFIHKCPAEGRIQVVNPVGTRLPAHATGSGKVMLACLPEEEIDCLYPDEFLPARTPHTITSKKALLAALADARDKGYACDNQESDLDIWAVASCIRNNKGYPIAALSVVAPIFRIHNKDFTRWHQTVRKSALEISARLGFHSN